MNYWNEREELRALKKRYDRDISQWRSEYWALHAEWEAVAYHNQRLREVLVEVVQAYRAGDPDRLREAVERAVDLVGLDEEVQP